MSIFHTMSKDMKDLYITNCIRILISFFQNFNMIFEKVLILIVAWSLWQKSGEVSLWKWSGGTLLIKFSKAFDCINHELLIAKLCAYDFDKNPWYFINSYLKERKKIPKKINLTTRLLRFFLVYLRIPYLDHSFLKFTIAISFLKLVT